MNRHPNENVALGVGVKLPTGKDNDTSGFPDITGGNIQSRTVDQSIQPGDGIWGIPTNLEAFATVKKINFFVTGNYLISPRDTNGVPSIIATLGVKPNAAAPSTIVNSVLDQYLVRIGVGTAIPRLTGVSASLAWRKEGVPAKDLIGSNHGFRRPGFSTSLEPSLSYTKQNTTYTLSVPVTLTRDRVPTVSDGVRVPGDATFADSQLIVNITHRFGMWAVGTPERRGLMRKTLSLACLLLTLGLSLSAQAAQAEGLPWIGSDKEAAAQALATGKPRLPYLHSDYCVWCGVMDQTTFRDSRVRLLATQYVLCKLNGDREGKSYLQKFAVEKYPFHAVLDSSGALLAKAPDDMDADKYAHVLATDLPADALTRLEADSAAHPSDAQTLALLAVIHAERSEAEAAARALMALSALPSPPPADLISAASHAVGLAYSARGDDSQAVPCLQMAATAATEPANGGHSRHRCTGDRRPALPPRRLLDAPAQEG